MLPPPMLKLYIDNYKFQLREILTAFSTTDYKNPNNGKYYFSISEMYRGIAIGHLLLNGDTDSFFINLHNSSQVYLHFLSNGINQQEKISSQYHYCTGRAFTFFDAVACHDFESAKKIAKLSRTSYLEGEEYEDDFCYLFFLMNLFFLGGSEKECKAILLQFEKILDGSDSPQLGICTALFEKDEEKFDSAINTFLSEYKEKFDKRRDMESTSPEFNDTEGNISVEGIALVRLAEYRGIETQKEYMYIPSMVRFPMGSSFPSPNSWKII